MNKRRINKLLVTLGLLFAGNGLLLSATPGRFASLRMMGWMPRQYNQTVRQAAAGGRSARLLGMIAAAVGITLVVLGVSRTQPTT